MITNTNIANVGGAGGTEGAIGADFDSLREDDTARGPLIRSDTVTGDSLNGFYLFAEPNGFIQPTSAMSYPTNPTTPGRIAQLHPRRAAPRHHHGPARRRPGAAGEHRRKRQLRHEPALHPARLDDQDGQGLRTRRPQRGREPQRRLPLLHQRLRPEPRLQPRLPRFRRGGDERSRGALHHDLRRHRDDPLRAGDQRDGRGDDPDPRARHVG